MGQAAPPSHSTEAPQSRSEAIRRWVADLPPYTLFRLRDVPDPSPGLAANVLHHLAAEKTVVERVAQGCYVRTGDYPFWNYPAVAIAIGGPGSGFGGRTAVRKFGWVWQAPCLEQIAVVGRAPRVAVRGCRFVSRANRARLDLNWAEITLLEAFRSAPFLEFTWEEALARFRKGTALKTFGFPVHVRPEVFADVAMKERRQEPIFYERVQEAAELLHIHANQPQTHQT